MIAREDEEVLGYEGRVQHNLELRLSPRHNLTGMELISTKVRLS